MKLSDLTFERIENYDPFNSRAKSNGMVSEWVARNDWGNAVAFGNTKKNAWRMPGDTLQFRTKSRWEVLSMNKTGIVTAAMFALSSRAAYVSTNEDAAAVIDAMPDMGGIKVGCSGKELVERALVGPRSEDPDARITWICVNRVDGDTHITLVQKFAEYDTEPMKNLCRRGGVLAYVYNVSMPSFSEMGSVGFETRRDGMPHRIW